MKRWIPVLTLALSLSLLAGCGSEKGGLWNGSGPYDGPVITARVVQADDSGVLLAGLESPYTDIYTLAPDQVLTAEHQKDEVIPGALVEVRFHGTVLETWPAQVANVEAVVVPDDGFDDLCVLYLGALEDMWEEDPALNDGISQIGFDLSETRLSLSEQAAIEYAFSAAHGNLPVVTGRLQDLMDQGVIDGENLYWEDGVHLTIREKEDEVDRLTFNVEKWRSGLGAFYFCDCTSQQASDGHWSAYVVGSQAIA